MTYLLIFIVSVLNNNVEKSEVLQISIDNSSSIIFGEQKIDSENLEEIKVLKNLDIKHKSYRYRTLSGRTKNPKLYRHELYYKDLGLKMEGISPYKKLIINNFRLREILISFKEQQKIEVDLLNCKIDNNTTSDDIFNNTILNKYIDYSIYFDKTKPSKQTIELKLNHHNISIQFFESGNIKSLNIF